MSIIFTFLAYLFFWTEMFRDRFSYAETFSRILKKSHPPVSRQFRWNHDCTKNLSSRHCVTSMSTQCLYQSQICAHFFLDKDINLYNHSLHVERCGSTYVCRDILRIMNTVYNRHLPYFILPYYLRHFFTVIFNYSTRYFSGLSVASFILQVWLMHSNSFVNYRLAGYQLFTFAFKKSAQMRWI